MSTVIDTLIFDRTQADVDRLAQLKEKALTGGWSALSAEEQAEWLAGMRGAYNYTDMNRVGEAVKYLAERFKAIPGEITAYREEKEVAPGTLYQLPYNPASVSVNPKTDWTMADTPTDADTATYLNNLTNLRGIIALPANAPAVPGSLTLLTFETANDLERLLSVIDAAIRAMEDKYYTLINHTAASVMYAGEVICGE